MKELCEAAAAFVSMFSLIPVAEMSHPLVC